uniref:Uncharacterized protein n=1 Tax=Siphoviridae sp. ct7BG1 TaxID=2825349 RepID=A0A8S5U4H2_9CAUD|nr:MAG TPA: hypothetical protein [Siphoviridae sp. ct7BG1]
MQFDGQFKVSGDILSVKILLEENDCYKEKIFCNTVNMHAS